MEFNSIRQKMKGLTGTKNWRNLVGLIDDGYKGVFVILAILEETDGLASGEIAKKMNVSTARVARALNTLEKKGFIKRERSARDGRKVLIFLTENGRVAVLERINKIDKMVNPMLDNLTDDETATLFSLLYKLLN